MIGDDEYKPFWMTDRRERWVLSPTTPRTAWLYIAREEISGRIAKKLMEITKQYALKLQQSKLNQQFRD
ncbi:MAG: hypothetical protein IPN98_18145 [Propionivibrio sp.]|nr:hypothetical protein [Propionivibrio sp.]